MRVGVVGLGSGFFNMLPELSAHPHVKFTAAADLRQAALDKFTKDFGGETHGSVEDLCSSPNVDVVYIFTPDELHAQHAIIAAERGKQVILDKPMGATLEECDAVIQAAERNSVRVMVGHSQSLDPTFVRMAEITNSGQLGSVLMLNSLCYTDWVYRPRAGWELDPVRAGGVVRRQGPIQVDIARLICGGLVRSVRGATSTVDEDRPVEGSYTATLEFENRAVAHLSYSGYAHFDTSELTFGIGIQGVVEDPGVFLRSRRRLAEFHRPEEEWAYKDSTRYGGTLLRPTELEFNPDRQHAFFGFNLVSCEDGDIRQSPTGLTIYGREGKREVEVSGGEGYNRRYTTVELDEMYRAWSTDTPLKLHDAYWGKATQEVCLGVLQSARERREVFMSHQTRLHDQAMAG